VILCPCVDVQKRLDSQRDSLKAVRFRLFDYSRHIVLSRCRFPTIFVRNRQGSRPKATLIEKHSGKSVTRRVSTNRCLFMFGPTYSVVFFFHISPGFVEHLFQAVNVNLRLEPGFGFGSARARQSYKSRAMFGALRSVRKRCHA